MTGVPPIRNFEEWEDLGSTGSVPANHCVGDRDFRNGAPLNSPKKFRVPPRAFSHTRVTTAQATVHRRDDLIPAWRNFAETRGSLWSGSHLSAPPNAVEHHSTRAGIDSALEVSRRAMRSSLHHASSARVDERPNCSSWQDLGLRRRIWK